jgi:hypothetical protein
MLAAIQRQLAMQARMAMQLLPVETSNHGIAAVAGTANERMSM